MTNTLPNSLIDPSMRQFRNIGDYSFYDLRHAYRAMAYAYATCDPKCASLSDPVIKADCCGTIGSTGPGAGGGPSGGASSKKPSSSTSGGSSNKNVSKECQKYGGSCTLECAGSGKGGDCEPCKKACDGGGSSSKDTTKPADTTTTPATDSTTPSTDTTTPATTGGEEYSSGGGGGGFIQNFFTGLGQNSALGAILLFTFVILILKRL